MITKVIFLNEINCILQKPSPLFIVALTNFKNLSIQKKNIFIVGSDDFNLSELSTIKDADQYNFESLLQKEEIYSKAQKPDVEKSLNKARNILDNYDGSIDGIIGFYELSLLSTPESAP